MGEGGPGRLRSGEPSATARGVAMRRAAHQLFDDPKVLDDPLATRIIGEAAAQGLLDQFDQHQHPFNRALRAHVVARSRYAERTACTRPMRAGCGSIWCWAPVWTPSPGEIRIRT